MLISHLDSCYKSSAKIRAWIQVKQVTKVGARKFYFFGMKADKTSKHRRPFGYNEDGMNCFTFHLNSSVAEDSFRLERIPILR